MDKLPDFILDAIGIKNFTLIMNYLNENPANILQTLTDGRNIIHLATQSNNLQFLKMVCEHAQVTKNFHLFSDTDHSGWNPIHYGAYFSELDIIIYLLKMLGPMATHSITSVINTTGINALQLAKSNKNKNKKTIYSELEHLAYRHNLPALSEPIEKKLVLAQYPKASPQLQKNIALACEAINQTRSIIKRSSTHPDANSYHKPQFKKIQDDINGLRIKIYNHKQEAAKERKLTHEEKLTISVDCIRQAGVGNCQEFSSLALHIARQLDPSVNSSTYVIDNADHAFVVIGRAPASDPRHYNTWGEEAIVCDAWSGAVYLASEIPKKLKYYWLDTTFKASRPQNVVGPFNDKFHILAEELSLLADSNLTLVESIRESKLPVILPDALPGTSISEIKYLTERSSTPQDTRLDLLTDGEFSALPSSSSSSAFYVSAIKSKIPPLGDEKKSSDLPVPKKNKL